MEFTREGFSLGPLFVHYYGVFIMFGVLIATWLTTREVKRYGQDPELTWDIFPWVLIAGVIGARLWHVFNPSETLEAYGITTQYYLSHPLEAIAIWKGGAGIPGGILAGVITFWIYARIKKIPFLVWTDAVAPGIAIAQAVGRWGNFINQELYGTPSNLPWAIFIEPAKRLPGYESFETFHPLFAYEMIWNLLAAALMIWVSRKFAKKLLPGYIFQMYLVLYPVGRFLLEYIRLEVSFVGPFNTNQVAMAVVAIASVVIYILRERSRKNDPDIKSMADIIEEAELAAEQEISEENEKEDVESAENDEMESSESAESSDIEK